MLSKLLLDMQMKIACNGEIKEKFIFNSYLHTKKIFSTFIKSLSVLL